MKKIIAILMILCLVVVLPTEAKQKSKTKNKIVGYEYKYIKTKVKVQKRKYLGKFYVTHYCPCAKCCGKTDGITASGTKAKAGRTVGVNPKYISYGTKLQVGKTKGYVAEDTGGGIGWKHLDIFCNSHQEALSKGVGWEKVYAITYKTKKKRVRVKVPIYEEVEK